ncbi:MAG: hypothetical protein HXY34_07530 [Candidatus Thorarchaeota archaeon]|nr:hypothetical protein [Candidatus Thorarchaeota archaeon]
MPRRLVCDTERCLKLFYVASLILYMLFYINNETWIPLDEYVFSSWLHLLVGGTCAICILISTLGMALFSQGKQTRYMALSTATLLVAFLSFLFALSYPVGPRLLPVPTSIAKSQMIAATIGVVVPASVALEFVFRKQLVGRSAYLSYIVVMLLVLPILFIVLTVLPVEIPALAVRGHGITPLGFLVLSICILFILTASYAWWLEFRKRRTPLPLAVLMAISMLMVTTAYVTIPSGPGTSLGSLVAMAAGTEGLLFVAIAMTVAFSIERETALSEIVLQRTRETRIAKDESEFYLYLWSHEVRNLLQSIMLYLELPEGNSRECEEAIRSLVERTATIIARITEMAQVKSGEKTVTKRVGLCDMIVSALEMVSKMQPQRSALFVFNPPSSEIFVLADELGPQVFVNLLKNSITFSPEPEPSIKIEIMMDTPGWAGVTIADSGPPLPEQVKSAIFDPFVPSGGRLGLGLFLVKTLVVRYKGKLDYVREDGKNIFRVDLRVA